MARTSRRDKGRKILTDPRSQTGIRLWAALSRISGGVFNVFRLLPFTWIQRNSQLHLSTKSVFRDTSRPSMESKPRSIVGIGRWWCVRLDGRPCESLAKPASEALHHFQWYDSSWFAQTGSQRTAWVHAGGWWSWSKGVRTRYNSTPFCYDRSFRVAKRFHKCRVGEVEAAWPLLKHRSIPSDILNPSTGLSPSYSHAISNRNYTNEDLNSARPQIDEMSRTRTM